MLPPDCFDYEFDGWPFFQNSVKQDGLRSRVSGYLINAHFFPLFFSCPSAHHITALSCHDTMESTRFIYKDIKDEYPFVCQMEVSRSEVPECHDDKFMAGRLTVPSWMPYGR